MLEVRLICMGRLKEACWREAAAEYEKRLSSLCSFRLIELPAVRLPEDPSQAQIDAALEQEGRAILTKAAGKLVSLCIEGKPVDSRGLAEKLESAMQSPGVVSFAIGSSHGLSPAVKAAGERISMSPMTFPHQLARIMLYEQLYRGFQIIKGTRYHK